MRDLCMTSCILTLMRSFYVAVWFSYRHFHTEQCLISMTEKWRKALDVGDREGAHQTDISKVFTI